MKRLLLAFLLLTATAPAQEIERVTVYGGSLSGFWQLEAQHGMQVSMLGHVTWGPLLKVWSRIDRGADGYATHGFAGGASSGGALEQDARHFHLTWGSMLMRAMFDGEVTSPTAFQGHYTVKLMGIPVTNQVLARGAKAAPMPDAPDDAGKRAVVRAVLNGETVAHDAALDADIAAARNLKLGKLESISFLGRQMLPRDPKAEPDQTFLAAYAVEFAEGEALCWVHQDDDGKLAAFRCA